MQHTDKERQALADACLKEMKEAEERMGRNLYRMDIVEAIALALMVIMVLIVLFGPVMAEYWRK